jgi:hypothetical protein
VRTIAPPRDFPVQKFTRDPAVVLAGYEVGRRALEASRRMKSRLG